MKPKTLVILSPGFPKDETDSTCLPFLQDFVRQLNRQYPRLKIVILAFDYPFVKEDYQWGVNMVGSLNGWRKRGILKLFKWISVWMKLNKIKKNTDLLGFFSVWCGECAFLGARYSGKNGLPHFCWILGQDAKSGNKYVKRIKPSGPDLIAISDFIQTEFEINYSIRPCHVIPAGVRTDHWNGKFRNRDIDILGVGSLIELKQYDVFIEIVHEVSKEFPQIRVQLSGKGPGMESLKKMITQYKMEKNITLTGEQSHEEILDAMSRAKIFLHPSRYEGLGAVCLEALSAGCHLISFVRSMKQDIPQWHIAGSKKEMTEKTISLLRDSSLQFLPVVPFTVRESVDKIMQLYHYKDPAIS